MQFLGNKTDIAATKTCGSATPLSLGIAHPWSYFNFLFPEGASQLSIIKDPEFFATWSSIVQKLAKVFCLAGKKVTLHWKQKV